MFIEIQHSVYQHDVDLRNNPMMKKPHASYERLIKGLQLVKAIPEKDWRPTDLQDALNISAQRANNWVERGVSQDAAVDVQGKFGINLHWILSGTGSPLIATAVAQDNEWPFKRIPQSVFNELEEWERLWIEDVVFRLMGGMRDALDHVELQAFAGARHARKSSNGK